MSEIFNEMLAWVYMQHAQKRLHSVHWLRNRMPVYAESINAKVANAGLNIATPQNIWGFIDGTLRPVSRPAVSAFPGLNFQREFYSGHKRTHGVKYQAVHVPDGLCASLYGMIGGRRHDTTLLRESGLMNRLDELFS